MTQRKAILTCTLSVAFLIPACLSFVQAPEAPRRDCSGVRIIRQRLVVPPDFGAFITGAGNRASPPSEIWLRIEAEFGRSADRGTT